MEKKFGAKSRSRDPIDYRVIIFTSLLLIIILAIYLHLSVASTQGIIAVFSIIVIAVANAGYVYRKLKQHDTS